MPAARCLRTVRAADSERQNYLFKVVFDASWHVLHEKTTRAYI
jgi:hypothetical protein